MKAVAWIKDAVNKAKGFIIRKKESEEAVPEEKPEKQVTLLDEALSVLSSLQSSSPRFPASQGTEETAGRICCGLERFSMTAEELPFKAVPDLLKRLSLFFVIASSLVLILTAIGLPYIAVVLGAAALAISLAGRKRMMAYGSMEGHDVSCFIEPEGEADRTVIFSAHHDIRERTEKRFAFLASPLFPFLSLVLETGIAVLTFLLEMLQDNLLRLNLAFSEIIVLSLLAFIPAAFFLFWPLAHTGESRDENLAPSAVLIALAGYYGREKAEGRGLANTRLAFAFLDGSGMDGQGSMFWYQKNRDRLKNAVAVNIDSIGSAEDLRIRSHGSADIFSDNLYRLSASLGMDIRMEKKGMFPPAGDDAPAISMGIPVSSIASAADEDADPEAIEMVLSLARRIVTVTDSESMEDGLASARRKNRISRY